MLSELWIYFILRQALQQESWSDSLLQPICGTKQSERACKGACYRALIVVLSSMPAPSHNTLKKHRKCSKFQLLSMIPKGPTATGQKPKHSNTLVMPLYHPIFTPVLGAAGEGVTASYTSPLPIRDFLHHGNPLIPCLCST